MSMMMRMTRMWSRSGSAAASGMMIARRVANLSTTTTTFVTTRVTRTMALPSTTTLLPPRASFSTASSAAPQLDRKEVEERVLAVLKKFDKVDANKVTPVCSFSADLGLDSLDAVEVVMGFEDEFGIEINDADADKITSAKEAIDFIAAHPQAK